MPASCYTVRPGPESGWLTFFELTPDRRCDGFFLVLGPLTVSPDSRRMAQGMARQLVTAYKRLLDPDPAAWLREVHETLHRELGQIEFGVLVLGRERAHALQVGRVRLVPLTAPTRRRVEAEIGHVGEPFSVAVRNGDRFFLGRVPREAVAGVPSAEQVQGLEQGGGGDGALILSIHSLRAVPGEEPAPELSPRPAPPAPALPTRAAGARARRRRAWILALGALLALGAAAAWWFFGRRNG